MVTNEEYILGLLIIIVVCLLSLLWLLYGVGAILGGVLYGLIRGWVKKWI